MVFCVMTVILLFRHIVWVKNGLDDEVLHRNDWDNNLNDLVGLKNNTDLSAKRYEECKMYRANCMVGLLEGKTRDYNAVPD